MPRATSCTTDLPLAAVQLITRYARGKIIRGTNRYALVCRQWREADDSSEGPEPLQLFADLRHMSTADITRAFNWMAAHGQQVQGLMFDSTFQQPLPLDLFSRAAPSLSNLIWLEVTQYNSLVLLAPVLGQLPQLQHLAATVQVESPIGADSDDEDGYYVKPGSFLDMNGKVLKDVPDLQQLCPQLVGLNLAVESVFGRHIVDPRVTQLLPGTLQQLTIRSGEVTVSFDASSLQHLTALQQLTLDDVDMELGDVAALAQSLGALQQLRVFGPGTRSEWQRAGAEGALLRLAPKLTGYVHNSSMDLGAVPQLEHLSNLQICNCWGGVPEGTAEALCQLTGLQHLSLEGGLQGGADGEDTADVLQQVAGMGALRSLRLWGHVEDPSQLSSSLACCTQLTALTLLVQLGQGPIPATGPHVSVPQQLTRLRRLVVAAPMVEHEGGAWLAPLSHLTSLCIRLCIRVRWSYTNLCAMVEGPVSQVRCWPAILQQVKRGAQERDDIGSFKRALWQFTPAGQGAAPVHLWLQHVVDASHGWSHPLCPCPHLPGVYELQGRVEDANWSRSEK